MTPFRDSTGMQASPAVLRERLATDGYLYLQGVVPRVRLNLLFERIMRHLRDANWLSLPRKANMNKRCADPDPAFRTVHNPIWQLEEFHSIAHCFELSKLLQSLFDQMVLVHPRKVLRIVFPHNGGMFHPTPPHQDFPEVQGTTETLTLWFPLHDCDEQDGGIAIARGSHLAGISDVTYARDWFGFQVKEVPNGDWHFGPMRSGDVLIFSSLTVHRAMPNLSENLRISVDCRYQPARSPICVNSINLVGENFTWEEVYANWADSRLKYYWQEMPLELWPYDRRFEDQRDAAVLSKANLDEVRHLLEQMRTYHLDPQMREKAIRLLSGADD